MKILITNDDGILAPGLEALIQSAAGLGELYVVAPETAQSAAAHSITLTEPLICRYFQLPNGTSGCSVAGRPADCVKLAMTELLPQRPDLVISGINAGGNVGVDVLYSGTVAAALEAAFFGVPAVAISLVIRSKVDFDYAQTAARKVLDLLLAKNLLVPGRVLNVNLPPCEIGEPRGIKVVRQSSRAWEDHYERRTDPRGRLYFWLDTAGSGKNSVYQEDTDEHAIGEGYISITPLSHDLTDTNDLALLKARLS
jgi:5'-nucleotidase